MTLSLKPEVERYILDQVQSGRFDSVEAVIEAAFSTLITETGTEIDDETRAAIAEGTAETERGEGIDYDVFREQLAKEFGLPPR